MMGQEERGYFHTNLNPKPGAEGKDTPFLLHKGASSTSVTFHLLLRYRNKIQNCILHQGVWVHM